MDSLSSLLGRLLGALWGPGTTRQTRGDDAVAKPPDDVIKMSPGLVYFQASACSGSELRSGTTGNPPD